MGKTVNRAELADTFGVSLPTVDAWLRDGMPAKRPKKGTGYQIDLSEVLEWHRNRERTKALGELDNAGDAEITRRKRLAETALVEHELALKRGQVIAIDDVVRVQGNMIVNARAKLLGLGVRLAPQVAGMSPAECQKAIDELVYEALTELSQHDIGPYPYGDAGDCPDATEVEGEKGEA